MSNPYAKTYTTSTDDRAARAARKEAMRQQLQQNSQLLQQLQQNPQLLQQLQTQDDVSILTELLGEMSMDSNRGGKRRRTFRRRTNKKRSSKRRR